MRNSIGGAWVFSIVLVFMMVLIAYISIQINYSNAYKLKTSMITRLEQYEGFNNTSKAELDGLVRDNGYRQRGLCREPSNGEKYFGVLNGTVTESPDTPQNYCVYRNVIDEKDGKEAKYYYSIDVFFGFNLPVVGDLYTFKVNGETGAMYYVNDNYFK